VSVVTGREHIGRKRISVSKLTESALGHDWTNKINHSLRKAKDNDENVCSLREVLEHPPDFVGCQDTKLAKKVISLARWNSYNKDPLSTLLG